MLYRWYECVVRKGGTHTCTVPLEIFSYSHILNGVLLQSRIEFPIMLFGAAHHLTATDIQLPRWASKSQSPRFTHSYGSQKILTDLTHMSPARRIRPRIIGQTREGRRSAQNNPATVETEAHSEGVRHWVYLNPRAGKGSPSPSAIS